MNDHYQQEMSKISGSYQLLMEKYDENNYHII